MYHSAIPPHIVTAPFEARHFRDSQLRVTDVAAPQGDEVGVGDAEAEALGDALGEPLGDAEALDDTAGEALDDGSSSP